MESDKTVKRVKLEAELLKEFFNQFEGEGLEVPLYNTESFNYKHPVTDKQVTTDIINNIEGYKKLNSLLTDFFNLRLKKEMAAGTVRSKRRFIEKELNYLEKFTGNTFEDHTILFEYIDLLEEKKTEKDKHKKEYRQFQEFFKPEYKKQSKEIIELLQENYYNGTPQRLAGMIIGLYKMDILSEHPNANQSAYACSLVGKFINEPNQQINHNIRDYYDKGKTTKLNDNINTVIYNLEEILKGYL